MITKTETFWLPFISMLNVVKFSFRMPFARRHFSHVVCGELLYIIGGFGNFRVHECNMFWYDCVKGKVK